MTATFNPEPCPICPEGQWIPHNDGKHRFTHRRKAHVVTGLHYSKCETCGSQGFTEEQLDENQRLIAAYEEKLLDYISAADIRDIRDKYLISQEEAGKIFQCGKAYFSKWERGRAAPTGPTAVLLRNALKNKALMQRLADDAGVVISLPPPAESAAVPEADSRAPAAPVVNLPAGIRGATSSSNRVVRTLLENYLVARTDNPWYARITQQLAEDENLDRLLVAYQNQPFRALPITKTHAAELRGTSISGRYLENWPTTELVQ